MSSLLSADCSINDCVEVLYFSIVLMINSIQDIGSQGVSTPHCSYINEKKIVYFGNRKTMIMAPGKMYL